MAMTWLAVRWARDRDAGGRVMRQLITQGAPKRRTWALICLTVGEKTWHKARLLRGRAARNGDPSTSNAWVGGAATSFLYSYENQLPREPRRLLPFPVSGRGPGGGVSVEALRGLPFSPPLRFGEGGRGVRSSDSQRREDPTPSPSPKRGGEPDKERFVRLAQTPPPSPLPETGRGNRT